MKKNIIKILTVLTIFFINFFIINITANAGVTKCCNYTFDSSNAGCIRDTSNNYLPDDFKFSICYDGKLNYTTSNNWKMGLPHNAITLFNTDGVKYDMTTCPILYTCGTSWSAGESANPHTVIIDRTYWYSIKSGFCQYKPTSETPTESNSSDDDQKNIVTECDSALGSFKEDLENIMKIIRIIGPILVIILSLWDYLSAIFMKDDDQLKKANGKLTKRLILAALLFLMPTLINLLLSMLNDSYISCIK